MRGQQQRCNDKACGALACDVTPRPPATETKAGPVRSPRAAAWCGRLRAARCRQQAAPCRLGQPWRRSAGSKAARLGHAPQPAVTGPARAAAGAKAQRCALREQRRTRQGVSGVSGFACGPPAFPQRRTPRSSLCAPPCFSTARADNISHASPERDVRPCAPPPLPPGAKQRRRWRTRRAFCSKAASNASHGALTRSALLCVHAHARSPKIDGDA